MKGFTGAHGGRSQQGRLAGILLLGIFTGLSLTPWELHGQNVLPTNPNVVNGTATFSTTDGAMQVVNSNGASIHWDSFSIGAHNSVYFQQSGSDSTVLNTVVGHNLSEIYGSLGSNGKVFLINQNGIFIGANATINTAGFLASTLNINNAEFKANNGAGTLHFVGKSDASITNLGTINAIGGDVYLIAKHVSNSGTITASEVNGKGGIVGMYATHELYLTTGAPDGGLVRLGSGSKSVGTGTGIDNSGVINAVQADLKATGNLYSLAINNSGVIRATGATVKNGVIHLSAPGGTISSSGTLRAVNANGDGGTIKVQSGSGGTTLVSGTVDASASTAVTQVWLNPSLLAPPGLPSDGFQTLTLGGVTVGTMALDANGNAYSPQKGGNVELSGDYVAVYDSAKVKADGPAGGGTIAIGGSAHGTADPSIHNALSTYIGSNATITADATAKGAGGTVVVWSNGTTRYYGSVSAKGAGGGAGGWVETSGHSLTAAGTVATNGGTWLLDPANVTITDGANFTEGQTDAGTPYTFSGTGENYISSESLLAALNGNNSVIITADGNIYVQSSTMTGFTRNAALTLSAGENISFDTVDWESRGAYTFSLTLISGTAGNTAAGGSVTLSNSTVYTNGGNILITGGTGGVNGTGAFGASNDYGGSSAPESIGVSITNGSHLSSGTGSITIKGVGGENVGFGEGSNSIGISISASTIESTSGAITLSGTGGATTGYSNPSSIGVRLYTGYGSDSSSIQAASLYTIDGAISIIGTGGVSSTGSTYGNSYGVLVQGGVDYMNNGAFRLVSITADGTGSVTISGTAAAADDSIGVLLSASNIGTVDGDISITGIAGLGSDVSTGLLLTEQTSGIGGSAISASGTGSVSLSGTGAMAYYDYGDGYTGYNASYGIYIDDGSNIAVASGALRLTGKVENADPTYVGGSSDTGLYLGFAGLTVSGGGAAFLTGLVMGSGEFHGITLGDPDGGSTPTFYFAGASQVTFSGNGLVYINPETTVYAGGDLIFQAYNGDGVTRDIYVDGGGNIQASDLFAISSGSLNKLAFGGGESSFSSVTLKTDGNILFVGSTITPNYGAVLTLSAGQDISLDDAWFGEDDSQNLTGNSFTFNLYANTAGNGGSIYAKSDTEIFTQGGDIVMAGGVGGTGLAQEHADGLNATGIGNGRAGSWQGAGGGGDNGGGETEGGVAILSSKLDAGGGSITLKGRSANVDGGMGVEISNATWNPDLNRYDYNGNSSVVQTSGTGKITITGVSGASSLNGTSHGVYIYASNVNVSNASGPDTKDGGLPDNISISGTGSASATTSSGVMIDGGSAITLTTAGSEDPMIVGVTITGTSPGGGANNHGVTLKDGSHVSVTGTGLTQSTLLVKAYASGTGAALAFKNSAISSLGYNYVDDSTALQTPYLFVDNANLQVGADTIEYPTISYTSEGVTSTVLYPSFSYADGTAQAETALFRASEGSEVLSIAPTTAGTTVGVGVNAQGSGRLWVGFGASGFGTLNVGSLDGGRTITAGTVTLTDAGSTFGEGVVTLMSSGNVNLSGAVNLTGQLGFIAGGNVTGSVTGSSPLNLGNSTVAGDVNLTAAQDISVSGSTVSARNVTLTSTGAISLANGGQVLATAAANLIAGTTVSITANDDATYVHSANTTISGAQGITLSGDGILGSMASDDTATLKSNGHIDLSSAGLDGTGKIYIQAVANNGTLNVNGSATGNPGSGAYVDSNDLSHLATYTSGGGNVYLGNAAGTVNVAGTIASMQNLAFLGAYTGSAYVQTLGGGTLTVDSTGTTISGNVGNVVINGSGAEIVLNNVTGNVTINLSGPKVVLNGVTGNVTLQSTTDPDLSGTVTGNLTGTFAQSVVQSAPLNVSGQISITVNGGSITLNNTANTFGSYGPISATGIINITGYSGNTVQTPPSFQIPPIAGGGGGGGGGNSPPATTSTGPINVISYNDTTPTNQVTSQSHDDPDKASSDSKDKNNDSTSSSSNKKSTTLGNSTTGGTNTGSSNGKETVMGAGSSSVIGTAGVSTLNVPPPPQLDHALSGAARSDLQHAIFGN